MKEDIKILEEHLEWMKEANLELDAWEKEVPALENLLTRYKKLEEENKKTNVIQAGRRNGKTIELAMSLREEILKLPECKLYGIKNCKGKVILLTKEEVIPKSKVKEKIEELENKIRPKQEIHQKLCKEIDKTGTETEYDYAMEELSILDDELREMLIEKRVLQELLERSREDET